MGAEAIAGEEERGTLDLLLAQPVPRRRLALDTFAAVASLIAAPGLILWLAVWIGAWLVDLPIGGGRLAAATIAAALQAILVTTAIQRAEPERREGGALEAGIKSRPGRMRRSRLGCSIA